MAEQHQYEIRNKQMLFVAGGLGIVAVVLVMWNEYRVRHENDEQMVGVVVARKDLTKGKKIQDGDVGVSKIPLRLVPQEFQGDIVQERDRNSLVDLELDQDVSSGRIMRFSYARGGPARQGSPLVPKEGFRIVPIAVNRDTCPPEIRQGLWVDIVALRPGGGLPVKVMERVLIKTLNGLGSLASNVRVIDSVGVEIREEDAYFLTAFISGGRNPVVLWSRNPDEPAKLKGFNPELQGGMAVPGPIGGTGGGRTGTGG